MTILTAVLSIFITLLQPNANNNTPNTKEGTEINNSNSGDFIVGDDTGL
jgi:hypothetical protein